MATSSPDREVDFTTIRITKKDKQLLEQLALPKECAWETFRRIAQAAAITGIKKKSFTADASSGVGRDGCRPNGLPAPRCILLQRKLWPV